MAKLTLSNVASFVNDTTAVSTTTANNDAIEAAMENTLSRDGTSPNTMGADFDMNSNFILNLPEPTANAHPATKNYVDTVVSGGGNVPGPVDPTDDGKILTANGGNYTWETNGAQPLDATLTAIAALSFSADEFMYATAADTFTTATITSFGRTLVANASAADARTDLGLVIGTDVQAYDADTAKIDTAQTWSAQQRPALSALTFDATQDWAVGAAQVATLTLTANATMDAPTGLVAGTFYHLRLDVGTGPYSITSWNAVFKWPGGTAPTLTATADAIDHLTFYSDGTNLELVGLSQDVS